MVYMCMCAICRNSESFLDVQHFETRIDVSFDGSGRERRKELRGLLRKMIVDWNGRLFLCLMALTKPRGTCAVSDFYLRLYGAQDVMELWEVRTSAR